jgi:hypothetical protein
MPTRVVTNIAVFSTAGKIDIAPSQLQHSPQR